MNGLRGQVAVQHVDQARNLELFKSKHNMGAKYVMDYQRGTATPIPVQVDLRLKKTLQDQSKSSHLFKLKLKEEISINCPFNSIHLQHLEI